MTLATTTTLVLVALALMVLAGVEKRQLTFPARRRCRRCHREQRFCSCPVRKGRAGRDRDAQRPGPGAGRTAAKGTKT